MISPVGDSRKELTQIPHRVSGTARNTAIAICRRNNQPHLAAARRTFAWNPQRLLPLLDMAQTELLRSLRLAKEFRGRYHSWRVAVAKPADAADLKSAGA